MNDTQPDKQLCTQHDATDLDIQTIASYYPVGSIKSAQPVGNGNSSSAKRLSCNTGSYILRQLRDLTQAQIESDIATALTSLSLSPPFIATRSGQWYIEWDGNYYNLQPDWWDGSEQSLSLPHWTEIGYKLAVFHSISRHAHWSVQTDRFELAQQWQSLYISIEHARQSCSAHWSSGSVLEQLEQHIPACVCVQQQYDGYVHGDLGMWNILLTEHSTYMIDYGEVRPGHSHFDIAALVASALTVSDANIARQQWTAFCTGYELKLPIQPEQLSAQLRLWIVRGAVALLLQQGISERTIRYAEQMLERIPRLTTILCPAHS
ncbi:phosphotransferase [Paenibacillus campi]|uniref:phosphotransferase n=1 Tax=Paenibacillus campi TaxID=3106031 RepID=UPI002AFE159E|nr:phosphotransferase [Paenibacillus sp. SGZ-1014]